LGFNPVIKYVGRSRSIVVWAALRGQSLVAVSGTISPSLLWPVLVFAKKTRKENLLLRLSRADTSKEGAEMLQSRFKELLSAPARKIEMQSSSRSRVAAVVIDLPSTERKNQMRKLLVMTYTVALFTGAAFASCIQASKAAASESNVVVFQATDGNFVGPWTTVLSTCIKPPGGKDLFIAVSAQTGVFTSNTNASFSFFPSTFTSENVNIQVRVLLDGVPVPIGPVTAITFDNLIRVTNQFQVSGGFSSDALTLVVDEGGARTFNWIAPDVGVGEHTITVQERFIFNNAAFGVALSSTAALVGPRTLTVEEVSTR
jgi:hypothetical protein